MNILCLLATFVLHLQMASGMIRHLTAKEAANIDTALMAVPGFTVDQLMELAGLAVATAIYKEYPPAKYGKILVIAGPGNNGGDGMVAARHLTHFGYSCKILYPKRPSKDPRLFDNLIKQARDMLIDVVEEASEVAKIRWEASQTADLIVDAIFGFSFSGKPRTPFDKYISEMAALRTRASKCSDSATTCPASHVPVVSVDIPSGWDVEAGDVHETGLYPDMLVSLTAPKLCAVGFEGHHWLGGRFIPPHLATEYGLDTGLPPYPGCEQVVKLS